MNAYERHSLAPNNCKKLYGFPRFLVTAIVQVALFNLVGSNFEILFTDIRSKLNDFKTLLAAKKFKCFNWMLAQRDKWSLTVFSCRPDLL